MREELPEGWITCPLGSLVHEVKSGFACGEKDVPNGLRHLRMNNIGVRGELLLDLVRTVPRRSSGSNDFLKDGDVLVCTTNSGKLVGKCALFQEQGEWAFSNHLTRLRPEQAVISPVFLKWVLWSKWKSGAYDDLCKHWVNQSTLPKASLLETTIYVPPISEQHRIVAKLETLLAKVDASRKRLERIPVILKRFRQAVLAAACDGRLTEDWRRTETAQEPAANLLKEALEERRRLWLKDHARRGSSVSESQYKPPVEPSNEFEFAIPETWIRCSVDQLSTTITSGSRDWKQYYREDGPGTFVMAQNVRPLVFDRTYRLAVAPPEGNSDRARSEIRFGDLLVTIVGANTGDVCRVDVELHEHYVCQSVALIRPTLSSTSEFLNLFLNSPAHGKAEYLKWSYGEGRPHLSFDHLRATAISLPPKEELKEIVRRVAALFALADLLETRYTKATAQVERLAQSVLAKAFRGELVPQNPSDEPVTASRELSLAGRAETTTQRKSNSKSRQRVAYGQPT